MTAKKQKLFWTLVTIVVLMFLGIPLPVILGALLFTAVVRKAFRFVARKTNIPLKA